MIKKIHSILFYASDLGKTAEFYRTLGFEVDSANDGVRVILGGMKLAFIDESQTPIKKDAGVQPKGAGVFTYVEVSDVDEYFNHLQKQGIETSSEPRDWPWGKREFAVKDPDGYKLVFFSNSRKSDS